MIYVMITMSLESMKRICEVLNEEPSITNCENPLNITIYFDCWAGNNFLRKFYTEVGFEYMGDFPEEDYFVSAFKTR